MHTACLDMEGVLFPEIWISVAKQTGIAELTRTTRDEPDYDKLMRYRLAILDREKIDLKTIQAVIAKIEPLPGVIEFFDWLRERCQILILSDTFYQFAQPLVKQLGWPTIFCHNLVIGSDGMIKDYRLRQPDAKREVVKALRENLRMKVIAMGDSYNDTTMLKEADQGILFCPPQNVIEEFPQFPVAYDYQRVRELFSETLKRF